MNIAFYFRYAVRSLRRGGQRTLLGIVCIAFGVMSLVAMQSLAALFSTLIVSEPRLEVGGDLVISTKAPFSPEQLALLGQLRSEGKIASYNLTASGGLGLLKPANTGHVHVMLNGGLGVDPATYPLVGKLPLLDTTAPLSQILAEPGSVVATRDLTDLLKLKVGDQISLSGAPGSSPTQLKIAAIATDTPRHFGDSLIYSLETARLITGRTNVATQAAVLLGPNGDANPILNRPGWNILTVDEVKQINTGPGQLFDFMFKGAGILGLIISGIGVANTLQVMFARRKLEIAVLKTLGYQQRDLLALFGLETLLLGIAGSIVGAVVAIALSAGLVGLFRQTLSLLLDWSIDPWLVLAGMIAGIATTLVFGTYSIVGASGVRPAIVLRELPTFRTWGSRFQAAGLIILLALVFGVISSVIMGSPLNGAGIMALAIFGAIGLSLVFGAILFVAVRLPLPKFALLKMSQKSLKRRQLRSIFPLIALFVGIFTIGFSTMVISNAIDRFIKRGIGTGGDNLYILAQNAEVNQITDQLKQQSLSASQVRYEVPIQARLNTEPIPLSDLNLLQGRPTDLAPGDLELTGAPWGTRPDGVYFPLDTDNRGKAAPPLAAGTILTITTLDGQTQPLPVVGTYKIKNQGISVIAISPVRGLLASREVALKLGGPKTALTVVASAPTDQLASLGETLGAALPTTTVISLSDVNDAVQRVFKNLLILAVSVAGLALVAGAVLIANSVALAMVERRREIGILKAVGFNRRHVLGTVVIEQSMLGFISGVLGLLGIVAALLLINALQPEAKLAFDPVQAFLLVSASVGFALVSALLVAWQPTRVRPLEILRDE